jgi:hypothetical protein
MERSGTPGFLSKIFATFALLTLKIEQFREGFHAASL